MGGQICNKLTWEGVGFVKTRKKKKSGASHQPSQTRVRLPPAYFGSRFMYTYIQPFLL